MLSGGAASTHNIMPWFLLTALNVCASVNLVGMRRQGFSTDDIKIVKWVFVTFNRPGLTKPSRIAALREREEEPLVRMYIDFIEASDRPIAPSRGKASRGTS